MSIFFREKTHGSPTPQNQAQICAQVANQQPLDRHIAEMPPPQSWLSIASAAFSSVSNSLSLSNKKLVVEGAWYHLNYIILQMWNSYGALGHPYAVQSRNIPTLACITGNEVEKSAITFLALAKIKDPVFFGPTQEVLNLTYRGCCFGITQNLFTYFLSLPEDQRTPQNFEKCFSAYASGANGEAVAAQLVYESMPAPFLMHRSLLDKPDHDQTRQQLERLIVAYGITSQVDQALAYFETIRSESGFEERMIVRSAEVRLFLEQMIASNPHAIGSKAKVVRRMLAQFGPEAYACIEEDLDNIVDEDKFFSSRILEAYFDNEGQNRQNFMHTVTPEACILFSKMKETVNDNADTSTNVPKNERAIDLLEFLLSYIECGNMESTNQPSYAKLFSDFTQHYRLRVQERIALNLRGLDAIPVEHGMDATLRADDSSFYQHIESLEPGSYMISFKTTTRAHVICYQKYADGTVHIGDSNSGLQKLIEPQQQVHRLKTLIDLYPPAYNRKDNHIINMHKIELL